MPIARLGDVDIRYEVTGDGDPVLLVAGLGGSAGYWTPNVAELARNHRVVLHDHRGTGGSSRFEGRYSVEGMADDLLRLMDHLEIDRAHLVGHSTGGAIGQVVAANAPDRIASLVLYASWAVLDGQMEMCLDLRRRILRDGGEAEYHRATPVFLYPPYYVKDRKAALDQEAESATSASPPASILDARVAGIMAFDGRPYLPRIACPTMVLVAEDDILTPPYSSELLAGGIAGARLVTVPRGGHALSRTEPDLFNETIAAFLADHAIAREDVHAA